MLEPRRPKNEQERLTVLAGYQILDTPPEPQFDRLVNIAKTLFDVPYALLSLTDEHRQWFKTRGGFNSEQFARGASFSAHVVGEDKILVVLDASSDVRFYDNPLVNASPFLRFYAGAPLRTESGYVLGTFCIADTAVRAEFGPKQQQLLQELADAAVDALEWRRQRNHVFFHAMHDSLTGLPNRLLLENRLQQTLFQVQRDGGVVALFRLALDNFQRIDNNFGHTLGDRLLIGVARRLEHAFRVADTIARWSGDDFAALVRLRSATELPGLIQRLGATLSSDPAAARRVAFSAGAAFYPEHGDTAQTLLQAADTALERAQDAGGGCCQIAGRSGSVEFAPAYRSA